MDVRASGVWIVGQGVGQSVRPTDHCRKVDRAQCIGAERRSRRRSVLGSPGSANRRGVVWASRRAAAHEDRQSAAETGHCSTPRKVRMSIDRTPYCLVRRKKCTPPLPISSLFLMSAKPHQIPCMALQGGLAFSRQPFTPWVNLKKRPLIYPKGKDRMGLRRC